MTITLNVTERDKAVSVKSLRVKGEVPAVVYGGKQEAVAVTINGKEFEKVLKEAGESTILELTGLPKKTEVLIKSIDFGPVKHEILHADLYVVEKDKEITAHVPLNFIDEAPVEKTGGVVNKVLQELEVVCKPADLPNRIDVSLAELKTFEDKIAISDLNIPKGVTLTAEPEDAVVTVSEVKEEVEEEAPTEVDMESIAVEEKGKAEEEASAE